MSVPFEKEEEKLKKLINMFFSKDKVINMDREKRKRKRKKEREKKGIERGVLLLQRSTFVFIFLVILVAILDWWSARYSAGPTKWSHTCAMLACLFSFF